MRTLVVSILIWGFVGCATTHWPSTCELVNQPDGKVWHCQCVPSFKETIGSHPSKPRPAGTVRYLCGDKPLPITIVADDVGVPACQP